MIAGSPLQSGTHVFAIAQQTYQLHGHITGSRGSSTPDTLVKIK